MYIRELLNNLNINVEKMYSEKGKDCRKICYCTNTYMDDVQIAALKEQGCVITEADYSEYGVKNNNYTYYIRLKVNKLVTLVNGYEIVREGQQVAVAELSDDTHWELTDYLFVEWDEWDVDFGSTQAEVHDMLQVCGWEQTKGRRTIERWK